MIILALLAVAPFARSHEGHVHEAALEAAPRGGVLRDAEPFKAEAVLKGDVVRVYVYNKELKPLDLDQPEARGEVQFPRQKAKTVTFKRQGECYEATIKGISKVHRYDLHLHLKINGVKALADFGIDNIQ
jgi:hypothetical protein